MTTQRLRIIQVSDLHISPDDAPLQGVDVRRQWLNVLHAIQNLNPDLLVLSGDLAGTAGEIEAYQWLAGTLAEIGIPYEIMMGNHDRLDTLNQVFPRTREDVLENKLCFSRQYQGHHLYFVDTADYRLSQAQIDWLQAQNAWAEAPGLLFIHHPPIDCGTAFMDKKHSLKDRDQVWATLRQLDRMPHMFCGHYHTERSVYLDGKGVHLTPSTMLQIQTEASDFNTRHQTPGWRVIDWDGERLITHVHYLWA